MAVLDPRDDSIVIRVVYDGTPMAGKTTSVGALGGCFGNSVHTPAEIEGRTLYFDWLEYTGGWFDGHQVRCQIVSVPGQTTLAPRRRRLLESADVVVFVGNSCSAGLAEDATYLRELHELLQARGNPPVGMVLQANKRDLPHAVSLEQVRALLEQLGLRIAVVESVATQGTGIREAFVLAVRLALDRVRELMSINELAVLPPSVDSAHDLLRELQRGEDGATTELGHAPSPTPADEPLASQALREAVDTAAAVHPALTAREIPTPPDANVASGLIWPPVEGRVLLHEITNTPPQLEHLAGDAWSGSSGRWHCYSGSGYEFPTLDQGRSALVDWARAHAQGHEVLSRDRCIALVADADDRFRLWQVVKTQRTLREQLEAALPEQAEGLAATMLMVIRAFLQVASQLSSVPYALPLSIECVAITDTGARYVGVVPGPHEMSAPRVWTQSEAGDVLATELQTYRSVLHERRIEVLAALARQVRAAGVLNRSEWALLQRLMLVHGDDLPSEPQRRSA